MELVSLHSAVSLLCLSISFLLLFLHSFILRRRSRSAQHIDKSTIDFETSNFALTCSWAAQLLAQFYSIYVNSIELIQSFLTASFNLSSRQFSFSDNRIASNHDGRFVCRVASGAVTGWGHQNAFWRVADSYPKRQNWRGRHDSEIQSTGKSTRSEYFIFCLLRFRFPRLCTLTFPLGLSVFVQSAHCVWLNRLFLFPSSIHCFPSNFSNFPTLHSFNGCQGTSSSSVNELFNFNRFCSSNVYFCHNGKNRYKTGFARKATNFWMKRQFLWHHRKTRDQ